MTKYVSLAIAFSGLVSCASNQTTSSNSVQTKLEEIRVQSEMPALAVRVFENDRKILSYDSGLRAISSPIKIEPTDKWHMGSCTKQMTAFEIGQLVDEKKIRFDSKLADVFPKLKLAKGIGAITIEQLLSHQSGLADVQDPQLKEFWITLFNEGDVKKQREEAVTRILKAPPHFLPGTNQEYSNSAYMILGAVVEHFDKTPWEDATEKRVFSKLGLKSCGFGPPGMREAASEPKVNVTAPSVTQPWGHFLKDGKLQAMSPLEPDADNPPALGPAGTAHCSLDDVGAFYLEVMKQVRGESKHLSKETQLKLTSLSQRPPYTYNTMGRLDREWASGPALSMNGSNTLNFMSVLLAPSLNRVFITSTNSATENSERGMMLAMKLLAVPEQK